MDSHEHCLYLRTMKTFVGDNAYMPETGEVRQLFMGTSLCTVMLPPPSKSTPIHSNARPHIDQCNTTEANHPAHWLQATPHELIRGQAQSSAAPSTTDRRRPKFQAPLNDY
jgi:hypothetical protein